MSISSSFIYTSDRNIISIPRQCSLHGINGCDTIKSEMCVWVTSSFLQVLLNVLGCRLTRWDQCVSMVQCCFTSTETMKLVRTDSPGRAPRLSHSSWTIHCCLDPIYISRAVNTGTRFNCLWQRAAWLAIWFRGLTLEPAVHTPDTRKRWREDFEQIKLKRQWR